MSESPRRGPLTSLKVLEFAGQGPGPFCGMLLSDLGADVIRIDRAGARGGGPGEVMGRGRRSVALDLKNPAAMTLCLDLIERADALIEGYRPGVMERLGLGPDIALTRNPRLVYGRVTGWGQTGPLAQAAGHDINYVALSGALSLIGVKDRPVPPLATLGDIGGGALYLALGLLAGIVRARDSGRGQVVDAAIVDGAASMVSMIYGRHAVGGWVGEREANLSDGGAHFYNPYRCADGKWVSIASFEPQFYQLLLDKTGFDDRDPARRMDKAAWPALRERMAVLIATRTQAEWCALMEGTDVCFAPVLSLDEAPRHPHNAARGTFVDVEGILQPGPAPRFSETPGAIQRPPPAIGEHNRDALRDWGFPERTVADLITAGAMRDTATPSSAGHEP
ncbi:CaiB/BaiF CoA transferase family protein [Rhizorhabdus dicambivorans]|uniref:CoA transferase n=1 Tax=Rhizorhabdus dicambivorans TaxID=1850238 RepID=A0A2A4FZE3_9SPHN|nr:CaiB/BaiF CoA-transferase family protein [Rhizorhabdus dicambivorans]ATE65982.1 CoA transferase [Rhizorhabdus dicambivorans]PCE43098.1 CoA transferase [Rhizorhabdus dicambivorans]